ncbi:MAG: mechanosensitive ion channel family protein [Alphaproteobacteria bacterium]|nr:mechanosensitive ion channel family protein [Alphaproteobacteria bacterium]
MIALLLCLSPAFAEEPGTSPLELEPVAAPVAPLGPDLPPQSPVSPDEVAEPRVVLVDAIPEGPEAIERLIPLVRARGLRTAVLLGIASMLFAGAAAGLRRLNHRLKPNGVLPATVRTIEVVVRLFVAFLGLGAFGALVPASVSPALPIVVMAAAVAVGWSARDVSRDLVAGVFIAVEGQLRAGYWVSGERYSGSVEALGLRVTWLRDVHGRRIVVPNRVLLAQPLVTDDKPWPRIQFRVALPLNAPTRAIRDALEEAVLLSPWVAPEPEMEVHPDALEANIWHVAVRVLDSRYAHRFQGLLRERVEEILAP